jgi:hypothetical protein
MRDTLKPVDQLPDETPATEAESTTFLRLDMPVMELNGRAVGRIAAIEHDPLTKRLAGVVVRHGWRRNSFTRVSAQDVTSTSQGLLVLTHTRAAFRELPGCNAPVRAQPANASSRH